MSRTLYDLHPDFAPQAGEWLRECNRKSVPVLVYCTYRSRKRQAELYAVGRDAEGNRIRGARILTKARPGESYHNTEIDGRPASEALDAVPWEVLQEARGRSLKFKLDWKPFERREDERLFREHLDLELLDPRWRVMAQAADRVGIDWAGRWEGLVEYVHFQLRR